MLLDIPHAPLRMPEARYQSFLTRYRAFKKKHPDRKPLFYSGKNKWTEIPKEFLSRDRNRGWAW
jgi:hypothetical protein